MSITVKDLIHHTIEIPAWLVSFFVGYVIADLWDVFRK